jgi:hypothetical protein
MKKYNFFPHLSLLLLVYHHRRRHAPAHRQPRLYGRLLTPEPVAAAARSAAAVSPTSQPQTILLLLLLLLFPLSFSHSPALSFSLSLAFSSIFSSARSPRAAGRPNLLLRERELIISGSDPETDVVVIEVVDVLLVVGPVIAEAADVGRK